MNDEENNKKSNKKTNHELKNIINYKSKEWQGKYKINLVDAQTQIPNLIYPLSQ